MKEQLKEALKKLSPSDFGKIKQLYAMTNRIKGDTIDEFVDNVPDDKTAQGIINTVNKQLGI